MLLIIHSVPEHDDKHVRGAHIVRLRFSPKKSFNYDTIERVCTGTGKVFKWVMEALSYEEKVRTAVEPLKAKFFKLQDDRIPLQEEKARLLAQHMESSSHLSALRQQFEEANAQGSESENAFANFNRETEFAKSFGALLVDEFVNFPEDWLKRAEQLQSLESSLDIDCLLAAAALTYLGGLPAKARDAVIAAWTQHLAADKLCKSSRGFDLARVLIDCEELALERKELQLQGLSRDHLSVMNACIVTRCFKAPLIIDPHGVFSSWIQKREKTNGLMLLSTKQEYLAKLRFAVEEGLPVLLENVDDGVPMALQSLASQQLIEKKGHQNVFIGDAMVPYKPGFRLYMVTRNDCPDFSPENTMCATLVDFNLTHEGFQECILQALIAEKAESLHVLRNARLEGYVTSAYGLGDLDPKNFLPTSSQDLVIDQDFIETISQVRDDWVAARQVAMANLRQYRAAMQRAEMLISIAAPLADVFEALWLMTPLHPSYQNVQTFFVTLVLMDLDSAAGNEDIKSKILRENASVFADLCAGIEGLEIFTAEAEDEDHLLEEVGLDAPALINDLQELGNALTRAVFLDLIRSLYEKDHLLFAFLVAVKTQITNNRIHPEEWQHFLTNGEFRVPLGAEIQGTESLEIDDDENDSTVREGFGRTGTRLGFAKAHPGLSWLDESQWHAVCRLSVLRTFQTIFGNDGVGGSMVSNPEAWRQYTQAHNPVEEALPGVLSVRLLPFQKLLLLRIFHPDFVLAGMVAVVKDWCSVDVSRIPPLEMQAAYEDSLCTIPLLFIIDPGTDPTRDIEEFSRRAFAGLDAQGLRQLLTLEASESSLLLFDSSLDQCMEHGHWLLMRNVHMQKDFSRKLEEGFDRIATAELDETFRLWITSLPVFLSKEIYRSSMRVVWDAPVSVRAGMLRSYSTCPMLEDDFLHQHRSAHQNRVFKRCIFAACMMHAALSERSAYGAVGWNVAANFSALDLSFCMRQIKEVTHYFEHVTVKDVRQALADTVYTAQIEDKHDLETFQALLKVFFSDSLISHGHEYTEDGIYKVPEVDDVSSFSSYVERLPTFAGAGLFGLDSRYDHSRFAHQAKCCIERMQDLHSLRPVEIQDDMARGRARLQCLLDAQETRVKARSLRGAIPQPFDLAAAKSRHPISKDEHRNRVLLQELQARNMLLSAMASSLSRLELCYEGNSPFTREEEQLVLALYYDRIPVGWMRYSSLSLKPLGGFLDLVKKSTVFFEEWLHERVPTAMWLPAFFFPKLLVGAATLNYSRHSRLPIESVALSFEILEMDPYKTSLNAGVYLTGLTLTCATWDFSNGELQPPVKTNKPQGDFRGAPTILKSSNGGQDLDWSVPILHVQPYHLHQTTPRQEGRLYTPDTVDNIATQVTAPAEIPAIRGGVGFGGGLHNQPRHIIMFSDLSTRTLYSCPMYRTSSRNSAKSAQGLAKAANGFIIDVPLPCQAPLHSMSDPHRFYVKLGTALLLETET